MPFDLGPKLPNDAEADYHPLWFYFYDNERCYPDLQFTGLFPWTLPRHLPLCLMAESEGTNPTAMWPEDSKIRPWDFCFK